MKLLLVTFFFPPSGGAGAQRPLKLAAHLPAFGIETHVLAPTDPKWIHDDRALRPSSGTRVHRARYLGPKTRVRGNEIRSRTGLSRAAVEAALLGPRLLLPDQHVLWNMTAIGSAVSLARRETVDVVLTTSPPSSVHLVGAAVKRVTGARWVADLRDPIFDHPHRRLELAAVRAKERAERAVMQLVVRYADAVIAASQGIARSVSRLTTQTRVVTIANGCDFEDFDGLLYRPSNRFRITHTGTFLGRRDPRPFLSALAPAKRDVVVRFVGGLRERDHEWAEQVGVADCVEVMPYVSHARALELQRDSEALLLLIPNTGGRGRGVLSAKLFEYVAAGRPILAAVPTDGEAAALVRETGAGIVTPPDDVDALRDAIDELEWRWRAGELDAPRLPADLRDRLSRRRRAAELADLLHTIA
jgi:glycosyltransferase involved in cell wall biosynthesis